LARTFILFSAILFASPESNHDLVQSIELSGRIAAMPSSPDEKVAPIAAVPPGAPPLLSFRRYQGQEHNRFANLDLLMDDAGH
jgi:hypothetical protein